MNEYSFNIDNLINSIGYDQIYLTSDFHILKEFIHRDKETGEKSIIPFDESKISNRNDWFIKNFIVPTDCVFIYLGDVTESEYSEDSDHITKVTEYMRKILSADIERKSPRILVLGNNDCLPKNVYKEMGFDYVVSKIDTLQILFTHKPQPISSDKLNIHGHIHGTREYWDIDPKNHIDVYFDQFDKKPHTLKDYLKFFKDERYSNGKFVNSENFKTCDQIIDTGVYYE